jgi:hypothetical protein
MSEVKGLTPEEIANINYVYEDVKAMILSGRCTPFDIIQECLIYLRDNDGEISEDDRERLKEIIR